MTRKGSLEGETSGASDRLTGLEKPRTERNKHRGTARTYRKGYRQRHGSGSEQGGTESLDTVGERIDTGEYPDSRREIGDRGESTREE